MKTTIAGIELLHPIYNAAGPKDITWEELKIIGDSQSAAITTKSCTLDPRDGNPKPRYHSDELGSINSSGLPNLGYEEYITLIPKLKALGKPLVISVSGLSLDDNLTIIKALQNTEVDIIELNLSCPNIVGKPQVGYDFDQSDKVLEEVNKINTKPLGVKLPPYFDFVHYQHMAEILNRHKVDFVTCINSVGNTLIIDPEKEQVTIAPKKGFGGLGGKYVKPIGLANVHKFYELLDPAIDIIGVGGISTGTDVFEYILAGAKAVQIGTCFYEEGPGCFERIKKEFNELMEKKGYTSIEEIRGKLKPIE